MKRQDFIKHLDQYADWWIDIDRSPAGSGRRRKDGTIPEIEPNTTGGYPVVKQFKTRTEFCHRCCKMVENRCETIDITTRTAKCNNCKEKYSVLLDFPLQNSK